MLDGISVPLSSLYYNMRMADKTRLLWLMEHASYQGGVETVSEGLIDGLSDRFDITVVVLDRRPDHPIYFNNPKIKTVYLGLDYLPRQDQQIVNYFRSGHPLKALRVVFGVFYYLVLGRFFLRSKIKKMTDPNDIVLASISTTYLGVPRGRKVLFHYHFNAEHYFSFLESFYRHLARKPDVEVFLSEGIIRDIKKRSSFVRRHGVVVVNPIKLDSTHDIAYYGGKLVYIGRLAEQKNPILLLKALKIMKERGFPFSLDMYGDGKLRPQVERFIAMNGLGDRVLLHGETSDVQGALQGKDLLVLSSTFEGLPLVAGEAMSQSVPVFSTRFGETAEESIPVGTGFIVDSFEPEDYANALMELLSDPEKLLDFREEAYRFACSHSKEAVINEWTQLLNSLAKR